MNSLKPHLTQMQGKPHLIQILNPVLCQKISSIHDHLTGIKFWLTEIRHLERIITNFSNKLRNTCTQIVQLQSLRFPCSNRIKESQITMMMSFIPEEFFPTYHF